MGQYSHRALRATVAAAGVAALSMSFVGTAVAATPLDTDSTDDASHALDNQSPETPSLNDASDALSRQTPVVDNQLLTFEVPRVETAAFKTPSLPGAHTVSHHSLPVDHDSDSCYGVGGNYDLPVGNVNGSCDSDGNTVSGIPVSDHLSRHADAPSADDLVGHNPDAGDIAQSDPSLPVLNDLPLDTSNLHQANGYRFAAHQV